MNNFDFEKLRKEGILVLENYMSKESCNKLIKEINIYSKKERVIIQKDEGIGGDIRLFDFEKFSDDALEFSNDKIIKNIVSEYADKNLESKSVLAGKVTFNNKVKSNSGGDWHRDGDVKLMKAMLYLSDVSAENGPFCFITKSKDFDFERRQNEYPFLQKVLFKIKGLPSKPPRYDNKYIMRQKNIESKIVKVTAKAGTLVIFDGSYIHRGDVIKSGTRYSLTNYYFPTLKNNYIKFFRRLISFKNVNI